MEEKRYGVGTMASYGMGKFLAEFLTGAYGAIVYKYYETTVGLGGLFVAAVYLTVACLYVFVWQGQP